jgi:hypothetical protein
MNERPSFHDADFGAFMVYAARERSLDASQKAAERYDRSEEHTQSLNALREVNRKMLLRETNRGTRYL